MATVLPKPNDVVLIAITPKPKDLEIARVLGWYRIPITAPITAYMVDFLAFYQPAAFGERKWQIEYFAEVQGHELVLRQDLFKDELDHPNAKVEYFKLQIGELQALPSPIRAEKWKRVTFMYTNGNHFMNANTLKDLKVKEPEEKKVFKRIMRERVELTNTYRVDDFKSLKAKKEFMKLLEYIGMYDPNYDEDKKNLRNLE